MVLAFPRFVVSRESSPMRMTGIDLARTVGLSKQSVSKILNGHAHPRQGTLSKLMRTLCTTAGEEQMLISAYEGGELKIDVLKTDDGRQRRDDREKGAGEIPARRDWIEESGATLSEEMERAARYLEIKALSVGFEEDVATLLRKAKIPFKRNLRHGSFIAEFIARPRGAKGPRVLIECKFNVNRDWERTRATAILIQKNMPCNQVIVAVPYMNDLAASARNEITKQPGLALFRRKPRRVASNRWEMVKIGEECHRLISIDQFHASEIRWRDAAPPASRSERTRTLCALLDAPDVY